MKNCLTIIVNTKWSCRFGLVLVSTKQEGWAWQKRILRIHRVVQRFGRNILHFLDGSDIPILIMGNGLIREFGWLWIDFGKQLLEKKDRFELFLPRSRKAYSDEWSLSFLDSGAGQGLDDVLGFIEISNQFNSKGLFVTWCHQDHFLSFSPF
jgi:hypothetical protein